MVAYNNDIIAGKRSYSGPLANPWLPLTELSSHFNRLREFADKGPWL